MAQKYKVGDKVRIKCLDWYNENKDEDGIVELSTHIFTPGMSQFCGKVVTIEDVFEDIDDNVVYYIEEIDYDWTEEMFECLVEEDNDHSQWTGLKVELELSKTVIDVSNVESLHGERFMSGFVKAIIPPEGYIFKDENGIVIDTHKIVLEKKKDVNLTQEQINKMVHDSCISFCKHCGCGIPRDTCISLGTCKEHDEYRATIRTRLMEKKKKEYPKTYEECLSILQIKGYDIIAYVPSWTAYEKTLCQQVLKLRELIICRDAYWKLYGEDMGLGKPWELSIGTPIYYIYYNRTVGTIKNDYADDIQGNIILAFPTEEMRDQFYNNFNIEIDICKNLL